MVFTFQWNFLKCMCMDCKSGSNKYLAGKSYLLFPKSFFVLHLNLSGPSVYYFHIQVTVFSGISIQFVSCTVYSRCFFSFWFPAFPRWALFLCCFRGAQVSLLEHHEWQQSQDNRKAKQPLHQWMGRAAGQPPALQRPRRKAADSQVSLHLPDSETGR